MKVHHAACYHHWVRFVSDWTCCCNTEGSVETVCVSSPRGNVINYYHANAARTCSLSTYFTTEYRQHPLPRANPGEVTITTSDTLACTIHETECSNLLISAHTEMPGIPATLRVTTHPTTCAIIISATTVEESAPPSPNDGPYVSCGVPLQLKGQFHSNFNSKIAHHLEPKRIISFLGCG